MPLTKQQIRDKQAGRGLLEIVQAVHSTTIGTYDRELRDQLNDVLLLEEVIKSWQESDCVYDVKLMELIDLVIDDARKGDLNNNRIISLLQTEIELLRNAIRTHRDQKGDDRCFLDDYELYKALNEPIPHSACQLNDPETMLKCCKKFIQSRHDPSKSYLSPERELEKLRNELELHKEACPRKYNVCDEERFEPK